jgi:hypothetical protein
MRDQVVEQLAEAPGGQGLECLPAGELAWLKPEPEPQRTYTFGSRYRLTDAGRRALAIQACFGPWPTVAEACARNPRSVNVWVPPVCW